jgi:hypothetical protein
MKCIFAAGQRVSAISLGISGFLQRNECRMNGHDSPRLSRANIFGPDDMSLCVSLPDAQGIGKGDDL